MTKLLAPEAVSRYRTDGLHFPIRVLSSEEAAHYRHCLEQHERSTGPAPIENLQANAFVDSDELSLVR